MKFLVTVKEVTDYEAKIRLKPDGSGIEMDGVEFKLNPFDENAIEEALRLQEKHGGEVVLVSIGNENVATRIRTGLAMGADRGILVAADDSALDGDLVARTLAKVYEREQPTLVILGKQAVDGDSNQAGQLLAEYLGLPQATFASKIELAADGSSATVMREIDGGLETIKVSLPAVITADLRLNEPRYASLPGIMKAKRKPIDQLSLSDLGVDTTLKVKTVKLEYPAERKAGVKVDSVDALIDKLQNEAKVL